MRKYDLLKVVLSVACAFSVIAVSSGCQKRPVACIDSKGKNIICFGDSITLGYGVEPGQDYPSLLKGLISFPVLNKGIDGDTSTEALKRLKTDVLDHEPLLVIIEFGGNDFLRKVELSETANNIEEMIKQVQSAGAMVAIADISTSIVMTNYGKEFRRLAKKYNTIFIPNLLSGIITNPSLKSDFIHPNVEGYQIVAQRIHKAILPYLMRNGKLPAALSSEK